MGLLLGTLFSLAVEPFLPDSLQWKTGRLPGPQNPYNRHMLLPVDFRAACKPRTNSASSFPTWNSRNR